MVTYLQLSLFGEYESFSTANTDKYLELIRFFSSKNYGPATTNQLKFSSNGIAQTAIMPVFLNDDDCMIELLNERINIKVVNHAKDIGIEKFVQRFKDKIYENLKEFLEKFKIVSNRLAVVCEVIEAFDNLNGELIQENIIEKSQRELERRIVGEEKCNIIQENNVNYEDKLTRNFYDLNTVFENSTFRFNVENSMCIFDELLDVLEDKIGERN